MSARRIGVLGLGSIGQRHARNLRALGEEVIAFDPAPEANSWFAAEFKRESSSREAVLKGASAVIIASPSAYHLQDLQDIITAGVPALVEKPFGHDPERACQLVERAEEKGLLVAAAQNLRYRLVVRRVRELLANVIIGEPVWAHFFYGSWLPDWRPQQDYRKSYAVDRETGGVIFDVIHEFDLAFDLLGPADVASAAAARSGLLEIDAEDIADIVLRHRSGCQTSLHLDYVTRPRRRSFTIAGTRGILTADLRTGALRVTKADESIVLDEVLSVEANKEYLDEIGDFLLALDGRKTPACSAREALAVLRLATDARRLAGLPQPEADQPMTQYASA